MTEPTPPPTSAASRLLERLNLLDKSLADARTDIRHAASRRATAGLALAVLALGTLLVVSSVNRVGTEHSACIRGNDTRTTLLEVSELERKAMLEGFVSVLSAGRDADTLSRNRKAGEAILANIAGNPDIVAKRSELGPRNCDVHPLDYLGF